MGDHQKWCGIYRMGQYYIMERAQKLKTEYLTLSYRQK